MSRLQTRFAQLKQENRAALVTFVTGQDVADGPRIPQRRQ